MYGALVLLDYSIRREEMASKQPILLGGAAAVPVPVEDMDLEGGDGPLSPAKKRLGAVTAAPQPKKEKTAAGDTVTLEISKIRDLLVEQSKELLEAQKVQLDGAMKDMEGRFDARVAHVEGQVATLTGQNAALETKVGDLEAALQELSGLVKAGTRRPGEGGADLDRRKGTLVIGGWPRDSRRQTILKELGEAFQKLDLQDLVDQAPFCTGPRRSIALMPVAIRPSETEEGRRARMFRFVSAFASNQILSGAGTKLWCSFSRTPEERAVAAHAALIKRVVATFDSTLAQESLDFEYKTGTTWGPDGMLGSANLPIPPKHNHGGIDHDGEPPFQKWIDIGLLAALVSKPAKEVREVVAQCRR